MPFKLEVLTAFVSVAPDGTEGIISFTATDGIAYPMIGADPIRVKQLYDIALNLCTQHNMPFKILQFSGRTDITDQWRKDQPGVN